MRPYYYFDVDAFRVAEGGIKTPQQQTIDGAEVNAEPSTGIKLLNSDYYQGLEEYVLTHEVKDTGKRRMLGNPRYVESISGGDETHRLYFHPADKFIIVKAPRRIAKAALRRLSQSYPKSFSTHQGELDFEEITKRAVSIDGSWFGSLKGSSLNSVGLFGDHVNLSREFNMYSEVGSKTALYITWLHAGKEYTCIVTRERGVIIAQRQEIQQDLDLVLTLRPFMVPSGQ